MTTLCAFGMERLSFLANTEYTTGFYTFEREVKEIDRMNRNSKGWEPE
jgi:hypothetical protein